MKFKREDIGLYLSLALVGGGLGLLIGAMVANRRAPKVEDGPWLDDDHWDWDDFPGEKEEPVEESKPTVASKKAERAKRAKPEPTITKEMQEFINAHPVTKTQVQLFEAGIISFDRLKEEVLKQEYVDVKAPYNYSGDMHGDDKPNLADLVDLPDVAQLEENDLIIDGRYVISTELPDGKNEKDCKYIYFDMEDEAVFILTKREQPIPATVEEFVSDETWTTVRSYLLGGYGPIFVDDLESGRLCCFELMADLEDEEESSSLLDD